MPLPAALLQRLQKRGIVPDKKRDGEEVFIESYDGAEGDADEEEEPVKRPRSGAPGCPNKWNEFHVCTDFCYDHWQEGMPESRLSERYHHARRTMLHRYPLPEGWREVYDAGIRRHYYWDPATDNVCWLSPKHPLAHITEAAPQVAKRNFVEPKRRPQADEVAEEPRAGRRRGERRPEKRERKPEVVDDNDEPQRKAASPVGHSKDESNLALAARREAADGGELEVSDWDRLRRAKKRGIDPMDPSAYSDVAEGGWASGLVSEAKTGVDDTATGPLFQQRPYPAPGAILRKKGPPPGESSSK
ncbi:WW domain-containing protein [Aphelenchoides fujianensis]|nr:WW domain-containing protein [Aphelenchoides fujianensis]